METVQVLAPLPANPEGWGDVNIDDLGKKIKEYCEKLGGFVNTTPGLGSIEVTFAVESGTILKFVSKASASVTLTFTKDSPGKP